ncbi:MAG: NUDIX domain-containing protein [Pseudomonadales bacterium]|nr:NUDIX domain-containing protein [Pseudomonadales bacterium]
MKFRSRVFTYITNEDNLLVFDHVHHSHTGTQIPGGTIEANEKPDAAAVREAQEETGIQLYSEPFLISNTNIDMRPFGKNESLDCWFYHLRTSEMRNLTWKHAEKSPSDGSANPIWFELYWLNVHENIQLSGIDDLFLHQIRERCTHA